MSQAPLRHEWKPGFNGTANGEQTVEQVRSVHYTHARACTCTCTYTCSIIWYFNSHETSSVLVDLDNLTD